MLHAQRHAERRLPVALQLMSAEIIIPAGNAVQLTGHTLPAVLMHCALSLFRRRILPPIAKHVDTGLSEGTVGAHRFAKCRRL